MYHVISRSHRIEVVARRATPRRERAGRDAGGRVCWSREAGEEGKRECQSVSRRRWLDPIDLYILYTCSVLVSADPDPNRRPNPNTPCPCPNPYACPRTPPLPSSRSALPPRPGEPKLGIAAASGAAAAGIDAAIASKAKEASKAAAAEIAAIASGTQPGGGGEDADDDNADDDHPPR